MALQTMSNGLSSLLRESLAQFMEFSTVRLGLYGENLEGTFREEPTRVVSCVSSLIYLQVVSPVQTLKSTSGSSDVLDLIGPQHELAGPDSLNLSPCHISL